MVIANYGVLSHYPRPHRTEHVHIGIVVFLANGEVRVHFGQDLKKLGAIDPTVDYESVRSWETGLPKMVTGMTPADAATFIREFGQWSLSENLGKFTFSNGEEYAARVGQALHNMVAAPDRSRRERGEVTRLHLDLKFVFQSKGWLGKNIDSHEIVEKHPLGPMTSAEFALKNGRLHVLESLDLRTSNQSAKRNDTRAKALTLDMANKATTNTHKIAVLAGIDSPLLRDARALLSDYSDKIFQWENPADMNALLDHLGKATGKPGLPLPH